MSASESPGQVLSIFRKEARSALQRSCATLPCRCPRDCRAVAPRRVAGWAAPWRRAYYNELVPQPRLGSARLGPPRCWRAGLGWAGLEWHSAALIAPRIAPETRPRLSSLYFSRSELPAAVVAVSCRPAPLGGRQDRARPVRPGQARPDGVRRGGVGRGGPPTPDPTLSDRVASGGRGPGARPSGAAAPRTATGRSRRRR